MAQRTAGRTTTTSHNGASRSGASQRELPADLHAEQALLGRMLHDPTTIEAAQSLLASNDFSRHIHAHIYDACTILHTAGEGVDPTTVHAWLVDNLGLDPNDAYGLGAASLLGGIATLPTTAAKTALTLARSIREHAHRRRLIGLASELSETGYTGGDPTGLLDQLAELGAASSETDRLRSQLLIGEAIMTIPPPNPLIDGLLDLDTLAAVYGKSGAGKSFIAVDWALSVATGSWWFGRQVTPGRVLYVIAEGAVGVPQRVDAWKHARQTWTVGDIMWLPVPLNIFDTAHAAEVARFAKDLAPTLIILDTLARSVPTADENSSRDMSVVVYNADRLRRATGACVLVVHHTGHDETKGMRGSTALFAAMDTVIQIRRNDDGAVEIESTKQKNRESAAKLKFALAPARGSLVVAPWRGEDTEELGQTAETMLTTLYEIDLGDGVTATAWMNSAELPERQFRRWVTKLIDTGHVTAEGQTHRRRFAITNTGLAQIGKLDRAEQF